MAVAETYGMGYDLFYIPVRAYWEWSQSQEHQRITELLSVIFAYLYQIAGIPFYSENGTYINSQYDSLYNWVTDGELDEDNAEEMEFHKLQEDTLYEMFQAGAKILRQISDPELLLRMEKVVTAFQHRDEAELELEFLGVEFLALYQKFPKLSISDCTRPYMIYPDEDDRISADMYTGFYWSARDCFADELDSMISDHFNETPVIDEPAVIYTFDKMPEKKENELDFAKKLFGLIEMLKDILVRYDHQNSAVEPKE
ncbi:hypothetical protein FFF34_002895 [Inquilinus sp. KBS0705]|nr:hypothetical protein FFF34_002895 [Inquilinus sp. KBS0705]